MKYRVIVIVTSNKSAAQAIGNPRQQSGQGHIREIYDAIEKLRGDGNRVNLTWLPRDRELKIQKTAKMSARYATEPYMTPRRGTIKAKTTILNRTRADLRMQRKLPDGKDFPGYTQSQRYASTSSWIWQFGYDIEKSDDDRKRRWVCKVSVNSRRPNPHSAASSGTQNAEIHLWNDHKVCDPSGRRKPPSKAKEKTPSRNIAEMMKLNTRDAREQQIANQIVGRFDQLDFQHLVVSWIINSNSSFRQSEDPYLRAAFEYLNPLVKTTEAHITHNIVRRRILQVYEENKAEINVCMYVYFSSGGP
ncbi:hypothetical protein FOMG_17526 [Fusarium oxysporum f. sp. melonis 26406]|uniref:Uncharacterized protein n=1 Tax=Fusarium oxysporum f. sp. melonis 26406 TaxID=1089452 RepID=W9Z254_FUSOX|nr:hypothetical protein FOMG_17526 [Fusarium oxysporum f. sp. melonis 26406]